MPVDRAATACLTTCGDTCRTHESEARPRTIAHVRKDYGAGSNPARTGNIGGRNNTLGSINTGLIATEFFKAWGSSNVAEATRLVDLCLDAGVNLFDTADVYSRGASEEILGKAIAGKRNRVLIYRV